MASSFDAGEDLRGYRIHGWVQGVGFRWWTRERANALGVRGRVWNRADGSVEVHAAGPPWALEALEIALGRGPAGARVERVERIGGEAPPLGDGFHIER